LGDGDGAKRSGQEGEKGAQVNEERGLEINVDFYGLRTLTTALRRVAPDLLKELEKTTQQPMNKLRNDARRIVAVADVPSGWKRRSSGKEGWGDRNQRGWDNAKVRNGIVVRKNGRTRSGVTNFWTLHNLSPAGAIYELAASPATLPQGVSFVRKINRQRPSRLIWRAFDEAGGDEVVRSAFDRAIQDVAIKFEQRVLMVEGGDKVGIS
jgi:hypothetical protein